MNTEKRRLEGGGRPNPWKKWGPYLTERQWGTVREDYSPHGTAWDYLTHDMARSTAYRWGEEGLAGISDDEQLLCFALGLWNGRDPILKERLFGLTNAEGNHGEDVKEIYYYLDSTPTHSYMKMLYKYPQAAFPYRRLVEENHRRGQEQPELELIDTGVFDQDRYFDVFVEYAKAEPEDLLIRITAHNRGSDEAALHLLPQLWLRNTWGRPLKNTEQSMRLPKPELRGQGRGVIEAGNIASDIRPARHSRYWLSCEPSAEAGEPKLLFCDNETNRGRLEGATDTHGFFKDGINDYVVDGRAEAVNTRNIGTKAAAHYRLMIPNNASATVRMRLSSCQPSKPFADHDTILDRRREEADAFYAEIQSGIVDEDTRRVQRQAFAGMLWTKQFYYYDVRRWLEGDPQQTPPPERRRGRNSGWSHLSNAEVISMPDKWEYPWYAAWDLAFHCLPLALVDADFAKEQLVLMTRESYMHPNGQIPAYEWAFDHVNPPVHAWAAWRVFQIDRKQRRLATGDQSYSGDLELLERIFHKLLLNFTWWVNRTDTDVDNLFQGGFLGLDNIGVFDRGAGLPTGGHIHQADGTGWMAMYALNLMRIALELARQRPVYEDLATKFLEHFLYIAQAMTGNHRGHGSGLWDEKDEFFYDVLHLPDDRQTPLKVRSMVGLIPLFAVESLEPELLEQVPGYAARLERLLEHQPDLAGFASRSRRTGRRLLSLLSENRMQCVLRRLLDETEFLSDHGIRALSRYHAEHPYELSVDGQIYTADYRPAESNTSSFGCNSNWRGPVWFPLNFLIIESLQKRHHYHGGNFEIECPTGSGQPLDFHDVAKELTRRLTRIFLRGRDGRRPVYGRREKLQKDPHFRDYILFYEYFHGDNGRGVGASHQTGWTGLVANLMQAEAPRAC